MNCKKMLFLSLLSGAICMACSDKKMTIQKATEILSADADREREGEASEYWHMELPLGEIKVPEESPYRSDCSHYAADQTLCSMKLNKSADGSPVKLKLICKPCRSGCLACLRRYEERGLIKLDILSNNTSGNTKVNVELTEEGNKWVFIKNAFKAYIKFGKIKPARVFDLQVTENKATVQYINCFYDLSPFALANGNKDGEELVYSMNDPEEKRKESASFVYFEDRGWALE